MNLKSWRTLGVIALVSVLLVVGLAGAAGAITNGEPDGDNHPYVGLVVFDIWDPVAEEAVPAWRATGILISPTVVLTAGHAADGAVGARVWFVEDVNDDPLYPFSSLLAVEGTPHTHPDFAFRIGRGSSPPVSPDIGVVILDQPVDVGGFGQLPDEGLVDTLSAMTDVDLVGYGLQSLVRGEGGRPQWRTEDRARMFTPAMVLADGNVRSDEIVTVTANPGRGMGGAAFGDSGGPVLLSGTNIIIATHSYLANLNATGVTYAYRTDIAAVLEWIGSFPP
jgi:hypothetical protein